ncbi:hypothetical protein [Roseinatronobacter sp. S2]|uniref:hypothetical protein n=1 Tax=Roseinatronobacter sp. S2 TaxID=3035471 RepID=UPI00240F64D2|nr:hypothetical protein [Roseinatronobacter sp. S2]WFE75749.1 hypothetical protein P8S53_04890 [Roseinatronobacter sp. S2]
MSEFEAYSSELLTSAKKFLTEAKVNDLKAEKQRLLRSALTHVFFFLEAQLNYLASHFAKSADFSVVERSLLTERDIALVKGRFVLTDKTKFYRMEDRIEFLLARFSADLEASKSTWFSDLTSSIKVRNRLVHPKEAHSISEAEVEKALLAVLACLSEMYIAIFGKKFPPAALGLHIGPET